MGGATGGWAVEYAVKTGSAEWNVTSGQSQLTGVTQVTKCTRYEADATSTAQQDSPCGLNTHVAHFGFPVELELEAQHSPEPSQWPTVYFQVRVGARGGWLLGGAGAGGAALAGTQPVAHRVQGRWFGAAHPFPPTLLTSRYS